MLLRLREVAAGPLPEGITITLAALGGLAAVLAAAVALRRAGVPVVAGRALCVIAAAPVVALTGIAGPAAGAAVSAGICAVMLVSALTPAWEQVAAGRAGTALAAFALAAAGSLPVGFGITALILELAASVTIGRAGGALVAALGLGAVLGAAAAVQSVARVVAARDQRSDPGSRPSALAGAAALVSLVAGVVPGATATVVLAALSSGALPSRSAPRPSAATPATGPAATSSSPASWSRQGYGPSPPSPASPWGSHGNTTRSRHASRPRQSGYAWRGPPARASVRVSTWVAQLDEWLVVQPQLLLVIVGAVLGLLLVHS